MKIMVNGVMIDESEAVIPAYDHGFLYGIGLFETFRTAQGKPFLLKEHLERLDAGCHALGIEYQADEQEVASRIQTLLGANQLTDAYVRYTVSAGAQPLGLTSKPYSQPNVIIYMKPLPELPAKLYDEGKILQRVHVNRNTPEGDVRYKSLHFMNNLLAYRELSKYEWLQGQPVEGVMLDEIGYVAEGITSNVFWVRDGQLHTPAVDTGILPGVTRAWVIRQVEDADGVVEGFFTWEEFMEADEVFITNSIQGIVPIKGFYDEQGNWMMVGDGRPGEYTSQLMQKYRKEMIGE